MSVEVVRPSPVGNKSSFKPLSEKKGRFSYYQINDATRASYPIWTILLERVYACANAIIQAVNYLHSKIYKSNLAPQELPTQENQEVEEKKPLKCDQETSLPLQEPDEGFFEPIQEDEVEEIDLTALEQEAAAELPEATQEVKQSPLTAEEMELFKQSQLLCIQNAYREGFAKREQRQPTPEELSALCSPDVVKQINEAVEKVVKEAPPEYISELKKLLNQAEEKGSSSIQNLTALGCGFAIGIATTLAASAAGNYLSGLCVQGVVNAQAYLNLPIKGSFLSISNLLSYAGKYSLSACMGLAQVGAFAHRALNWGAMAFFAGSMIKVLCSLKQVPKPLEQYLSMTEIRALQGLSLAGAGCGSYMGYLGLKSYVTNQQHALTNEGGILIRNNLAKVTNILKDRSLNYLIPKSSHQEFHQTFDQGYTVGTHATLAYLFAATIGLGAWTAVPLALAASTGIHMIKQQVINNHHQ